MKVKKSKTVHIETGKYIAELSDCEDTVITPKSGRNKGKKLPCVKVVFEILDEPGQEEVAGISLNKTLWYNLDKDQNVCMGGASIQVIEALQGEMEELEKSDDLEDLIGTKVYLQIVGAEEEEGYPDIHRVEAYAEKPGQEEKKKPEKKKAESDPDKAAVEEKKKPEKKKAPPEKPEEEESTDASEDDGTKDAFDFD